MKSILSAVPTRKKSAEWERPGAGTADRMLFIIGSHVDLTSVRLEPQAGPCGHTSLVAVQLHQRDDSGFNTGSWRLETGSAVIDPFFACLGSGRRGYKERSRG